jgi:hypothetical protein
MQFFGSNMLVLQQAFDALHADPDAIYKDLDEDTHHTLIGKRPFNP